MPRQVITPEEKDDLSALEMKHAMGGVSETEQKRLFDLRKKKELQKEIDKSHIE